MTMVCMTTSALELRPSSSSQRSPFMLRGREVQRRTIARRDQHSGDVRLRYYILACVSTKVARFLLRHVVHIPHVVFETGNAPPEAERVREAGRPLTAEGRCHGARCLHRFQLHRAEVGRLVELSDLGLESGKCLPEIFP